jgi:hypothetical protein
MTLTLTRKEIDEYARKNRYAIMMFHIAASDYFACRCCILNMLSSGFRLASEAVEKLLKATIFLRSGAKCKLEASKRHNPYLLKEELKSACLDPTLDGYDALLNKLHDHYQSRYPDNRTTGRGSSSQELPEIDALFLHLVEALPMPDEVKYRTKFFTELCDEDSRLYWRNYYWAVECNQLLQSKMPSIEAKYQQVLKHLYG